MRIVGLLITIDTGKFGNTLVKQALQRVQVDMERLKTENLRLREKCTQLAARRKGAVAGLQRFL